MRKNLEDLVSGYTKQLGKIKANIDTAKSKTAVAHRLATYYTQQETIRRKDYLLSKNSLLDCCWYSDSHIYHKINS